MKPWLQVQLIAVIQMAIFYFKMAKELSESIFIWKPAINCTSNHGFIHFTIFFITFLSLQKGLKMAILSLKMAIFDLTIYIQD